MSILRPTRLNLQMLETHRVVGIIPTENRVASRTALTTVIASDVLVLTGRQWHESLRENNPSIQLMTPQMYYRHPVEATTIVLLESETIGGLSHQTVVLTRKK